MAARPRSAVLEALVAYLDGAYMNVDSQGQFFWDHPGGDRGIIWLSHHSASSGRRKYRSDRYQFRFNSATERVIRELSDPAVKPGSWVVAKTKRVYRALLRAGHLVTCEAYTRGAGPQLVGAVLGVNLYPLFVADTMYGLPAHRRASAECLAELVSQLHKMGFLFVDTQKVHPADHPAARLGEVSLSKPEFLRLTKPIRDRILMVTPTSPDPAPNPHRPGPNRTGDLQFDRMGASYIRSLELGPDVREEEWLMLKSRLKRPHGACLDYACGDGFITSKLLSLDPHLSVVGVDNSVTMMAAYQKRFSDNPRIRGVTVEEFEQLRSAHFGTAICLGGFHHVHDPVHRMSVIRDRMTPGGSLLIADFADQSPSQAYFDDLINRYNPTGHVGFFLSESRAVNLGRACALKLVDYRQVGVAWRFSSEHELSEFVVQHHGLSCTPRVALNYLKNHGMISSEGGFQLRHTYCLVEYRAS